MYSGTSLRNLSDTWPRSWLENTGLVARSPNLRSSIAARTKSLVAYDLKKFLTEVTDEACTSL